MKLASPYFLQAASAHPTPLPDDYIALQFPTANPTQDGFLITDEVTVISTYNSKQHKEKYPAGTTSISFKADANTDVYIYGKVFWLQANNSSFKYFAIHSEYFQEVDILYDNELDAVYIEKTTESALSVLITGCHNFTSLQNNAGSILRELVMEDIPALQGNLDLRYIKAESIRINYCQNVTGITLLDNTFINHTFSCSGCANLTSLILPQAGNIHYIFCDDCPNLANIDFSNATQLETLICSGCSSFTTVDVLSTYLYHIVCNDCTSLAYLGLRAHLLDRIEADNVRNIAILSLYVYGYNNDTSSVLASRITNSTVNDGTLNIKSPGNATIINAATAKGWTVNLV